MALKKRRGRDLVNGQGSGYIIPGFTMRSYCPDSAMVLFLTGYALKITGEIGTKLVPFPSLLIHPQCDTFFSKKFKEGRRDQRNNKYQGSSEGSSKIHIVRQLWIDLNVFFFP